MALVQDLPEWLEQGTESSLRDTEDDNQPPGPVRITTPRSVASMPHGPTPVILTPTGGHSPTTTGGSPAPWTDLDKFYADVDEAPGSDDGGNDDTDDSDSDNDGEGSSASEGDIEGDVNNGSGDEETTSESEGSITSEETFGDNSRGLA